MQVHSSVCVCNCNHGNTRAATYPVKCSIVQDDLCLIDILASFQVLEKKGRTV